MTLEELSDVPEYSVSKTLAGKAFDLVRLCERMNGIKILMSAPGAITGLLAEKKPERKRLMRNWKTVASEVCFLSKSFIPQTKHSGCISS